MGINYFEIGFAYLKMWFNYINNYSGNFVQMQTNFTKKLRFALIFYVLYNLSLI